ncbi:uncharacterized protein LOC111467529 [Cucurbita maxima]|uniref:aspartyl aminopeptidase n=1 Tax=Cucurbita maxima TaxID=3661 RepID=A0A6J1HWN1_CUCMA|nr:uncharacterized protein LOC111467529 [Cucurbita maxima]
MDKHEEEHHRPEMPKGLVIKRNANQRYATSGVTSFLFREIGRIHNLPTPGFCSEKCYGLWIYHWSNTWFWSFHPYCGLWYPSTFYAQASCFWWHNRNLREGRCSRHSLQVYFKAFYETFSSIDRRAEAGCLIGGKGKGKQHNKRYLLPIYAFS